MITTHLRLLYSKANSKSINSFISHQRLSNVVQSSMRFQSLSSTEGSIPPPSYYFGRGEIIPNNLRQTLSNGAIWHTSSHSHFDSHHLWMGHDRGREHVSFLHSSMERSGELYLRSKAADDTPNDSETASRGISANYFFKAINDGSGGQVDITAEFYVARAILDAKLTPQNQLNATTYNNTIIVATQLFKKRSPTEYEVIAVAQETVVSAEFSSDLGEEKVYNRAPDNLDKHFSLTCTAPHIGRGEELIITAQVLHIPTVWSNDYKFDVLSEINARLNKVKATIV